MERIRLTTSENGWNPIIGDETRELVRYLGLPTESSNNLQNETGEILRQCGNPAHQTNREIGLVFGYVQSGKTMSFTTLTAMAKDNGYQLIIIIAGISTNLVAQSFTRLEKDLRLNDRHDMQWLSFKNPTASDLAIRQQIENAFIDHKDPTVPVEDKKVVLITVMKQKNHLPNLQALLDQIDLTEVPTLIIDDEGDQHSMNRFARQNARRGGNRRSTINDKIMMLRDAIPHHTFIQYTATPQAQLFANIMNNMSPNFIQLLTPGPAYTGGRTFFNEHPELTTVIDDIDPQHPPTSPPQSLIYAMQIFFLGVSKGWPRKDARNRSMMIHPSQQVITHGDYVRFTTNIQNHFVEVLGDPDTERDKIDLLNSFRVAYDDLTTTASDLPPFEELTVRLRQVIRSTVIQPLNSVRGNRTTVEWRNSYSWILIGGTAMDRGFTVEGLTVTYMPRSVGMRNADTIQQRARFFGYKQQFLGYCRVYLDRDARDAFIDYVEHEEDMRQRLLVHKQTGQPLNDWYREVTLSGGLNLSRANVLDRDLQRSNNGDWSYPRIPQESEDNRAYNECVFREFLQNAQLQSNSRFPSWAGPLSVFMEQVVSRLRFANSNDFTVFSSVLYTLERQLEEDPDETCVVHVICDFTQPRIRTLNERDQIKQLFQGPNERSQGLREVKGSGISFQMYVLNLQTADGQTARNVPVLATYIPPEIADEIIRWA